jgi:hypothetical protein
MALSAGLLKRINLPSIIATVFESWSANAENPSAAADHPMAHMRDFGQKRRTMYPADTQIGAFTVNWRGRCHLLTTTI